MNMGEERILALPTSQGHYTVASDVLAMAGPWRLVVETSQGVVVTSFNLEQDLSGNNTRTTSLAHGHAGGPQPWNRLLMAAALAFGITAAVLCTRWSPWRRIRPKHAAVAAGVLFTGGILQYLSYNTAWSKSLVAPPGLVNAKKADAVSVVRGERIYAANCTVCHGWRGFGDGPATARGKLLPADLTSLHLSYHLDGQLYWWVTNGVPRSSMPGFKDSLTDEDRWDVVNYVRTLRHVKEQETLPLVQQAVVALFSGNRDLFAHVAAPAVVAALEAGEIALPGEQRSLLVDMDQVQVREFENEVLDEGLTYRAKIPGTQQPADIYMTLNRFEGKWLVTKFWITPPETNKRSGATSPAPVLPGRT
jgi:mono/diheme cytochrome c family protein